MLYHADKDGKIHSTIEKIDCTTDSGFVVINCESKSQAEEMFVIFGQLVYGV